MTPPTARLGRRVPAPHLCFCFSLSSPSNIILGKAPPRTASSHNLPTAPITTTKPRHSRAYTSSSLPARDRTRHSAPWKPYTAQHAPLHGRRTLSALFPTATSRATSTATATTTTASTATATATRTMATDDDYMAFLDKANEDASEATSSASKKGSGGGKQLKATDAGAQIPAGIRDAVADVFYASDADEPFVPVSLAWPEAGDKGLPDEAEFARLIEHPSPQDATRSIEILDPASWDPRGQYAGVLAAVRDASRGSDVRVYRVPTGGARAEYWVVSAAKWDGGDARIVGAKALAVES